MGSDHVSRTHRDIALITGAASGIGAAAAARLANRGWSLVLIDLDADRLEASAEALAGSVLITRAMDVRDTAAWELLMQSIGHEGHSLTLALINAGIAHAEKPLTETTDDEIERVVGVNLIGAIRTARACIPLMAAPHGSMIFTSSTSGLVAAPGNAVYAGTKIALIGIARSLAAELAPGLRVNAVCPGGVDTPLTREIYGAEEIDRQQADAPELNPLRRVAQPDDVADAVEYLASARHVTGVCLRVDGGQSVFGAL